MLAMADQAPSDAAAKAVADVLRRGHARNDHWLADAATAAAARNDLAFLKAIATMTGAGPAGGRPGPELLRVVERVAEHWARGGPVDQAGGLLAALNREDAAIDEALLRGMARGWPRGRPAKLDPATAEAVKQLALKLPSAARGQLVRLVSPWGDPVLAGINAEMAATLLNSARDDSLSDSRRRDAARQLVELRPTSDETARSCWL